MLVNKDRSKLAPINNELENSSDSKENMLVKLQAINFKNNALPNNFVHRNYNEYALEKNKTNLAQKKRCILEERALSFQVDTVLYAN